MIRILPSFAATLAACTSPPQETAMHSRSQDPTPKSASKAGPEVSGDALNPKGQSTAKQEPAAVAPVPQQVSAAENLAPARSTDSPAEAQGRRTLSTAFVRVGPDGRLTVELHNGRVLVLRDLVMRRKDYCGVHVLGRQAGAQYCGGYSEIAAARPGGPPAPAEPDLAAPNPIKRN